MQVPNSYVSITAAGEADFGVRADGQGVACRGRGGELGFDAGCLRGQIPDGQCAGLASNNQCAAIRQQLTGADVVISVLLHRGQSQSIYVQSSAAGNRFGNKDENPSIIINQTKGFLKPSLSESLEPSASTHFPAKYTFQANYNLSPIFL